MAHPNQQKFCEDIKKNFPKWFEGSKVLDIGSLNVNGSNRYLFEECEYTGLDVAEGKNVDVGCIAHEYNEPEESFDVIISTNAMEHDMYYKLTLQKMVFLLKSGGLLLFSAANSFKEHGTKRKSPRSSNTSLINGSWSNYYKNLTPKNITDVLNLEQIFNKYKLEVIKKDLTFWGIKKEDKFNGY